MSKVALNMLVDAIHTAMRSREWSQSELAAKSGVSQKTISNILGDRGDTTISTAEALTNALGLSLGEVLSDNMVSSKKMETIQAVRAANFRALEGRYLTLKEFAESVSKPPALFSQIRNGANRRHNEIGGCALALVQPANIRRSIVSQCQTRASVLVPTENKECGCGSGKRETADIDCIISRPKVLMFIGPGSV